MSMIPVDVLAELSRADLSSAALRLALALLGAAAHQESATVAELGQVAGVLERGARAILSQLLGRGGVLARWVCREDHGRAPRWMLRDQVPLQVGLPLPSPTVGGTQLGLPGTGHAGLPGTGHAGLPGTEPPHTPLGFSPSDLDRSFNPSPQGEREGEREDLLEEVPEDAAATVAPLAAALAAEGALAAQERQTQERRPVQAASQDAWGRALWALALSLGSGTPDLPMAGRYLLAGLTCGPRAGFPGWRRLLAVAPSVCLRRTFRRAVASGWGVEPGWSPPEQAGRDPLGDLAAGAVKPRDSRASAEEPSTWSRVQDQVRADLGVMADPWIDLVHPVRLDGDVLLAVPNQLYLDGVQDHLEPTLLRVLGVARIQYQLDPCRVTG